MAKNISSPLQDTAVSSKTDESETPVSTMASGSDRAGSDRGYYGDAEDTDSDEVLLDVDPDIQTVNETKSTGIFKGASSLSTTRKLVIGLFIVLVIACSWVGSTQLAKSTYAGSFRAPFFLVWFGTSWMMLLYPLCIPVYFVTKRKLPTWSAFVELWSHSREIINPPNSSPVTFLTSTVLFTLIWVPTNYLYARALITAPPTDVTALFSTAPAFVFLFSMILLREPPLILRFLAVLLAVGGIMLFCYQEGFRSASTIGLVLSIGSAIGAALYKTLLKLRVKQATLYQMSLFLSSIGVFCTVVFWPLLIILNATGVEVIQDVHWAIVTGHAIVGVLFNFAINFGIAYTFPLFISLGTILGIPINAVIDVLFRHVDLANWKITAMDMIVGGFLLMLVPPDSSEWIQRTSCFLIKCKCCKNGCRNCSNTK